MVNFVEKLKNVLLEEKGVDILKFLVNERFSNFNSDCCSNCKEFEKYLNNNKVNKNLKGNSYVIEIDNNYYDDFTSYFNFLYDDDSICESNEVAVNIENFFKTNIINLCKIYSNFSNEIIYYCDKCFRFYKHKEFYLSDETHSYFLIDIFNNKNDVFKILSYVYVYTLLENLSDAYKNLKFDDNTYVYCFMDYLSFKEDILSEEDLIIESILGKRERVLERLHFDFDSIKSLLMNMDPDDFCLCRVVVNEKDLMYEFDKNKLSDGIIFNIYEKNVKSYEIYDVLNNKWVSINDCDLDNIKINNKKVLIDLGLKGKEYLNFYYDSNAFTLYNEIINFYNENIENIIKKGD